MARTLNRLSSREVATLSKPGRHADGGRLYLSISAHGRKAWCFLYVRNGRQREMGLGAFSDISLATARQLAAVARTQLATGIDPLDARRASAAIPTFGEMADEVLKVATASSRNEKVRYAWGRDLKEQAASLRSISVDKVTTDDVLSILRPLWETRPETASKLRGRIERVLDAAAAKGHRPRENPAAWKGHLESLLPARQKLTRGHHQALPFAEVPVFLIDLRSRSATAARMLEFTILTAARIGEVLGATWQEIDLKAAVWTVPAERMKLGKEHRVPLAPPALAVLAAMRTQASNAKPTDFVFPGAKADRPLSNMSAAALFKRMGVETTTHGFRSSFRDWCGEMTTFPREIAEAALAHHVGNEVERAYRRGDALEKRRELMTAWGEYLSAAS